MAKKKDKYGDPVKCVISEHEGIKIKLVLGQRLDNPPESPYHCLRWWTFYPGHPDKYRRFYKYKGKYRTIPVDLSLQMFKQARDKGMLEEKYDRKSSTTIFDSRDLPPSERSRIFGEVLSTEGEPEWGDNPIAVISEGPAGAGIWREMMLIDSAVETCTFRSTTTLARDDYSLASDAPGIYPHWRLDNAMQELDTEATRQYLRVLEELAQ